MPRWWWALVACLCVSVASADTEVILNERHLERFLREACEMGCDVFLFARDNPASLVAKRNLRARPNVPLAIVHAPDFERYRAHGTPQTISMQARRRRRLQATNLFRYDEIAGRITHKHYRIMLLGGVLKGEFVRNFALEAEQDPGTLHVYAEVRPAHTSPQIAKLHETFSLMLLGRHDQTRVLEFRDGKLVSEESYTEPEAYGKQVTMRRR